jgi:hypothetical protein
MPIQVTCACGKVYKFKDEVAGRRAKCPACGAVVAIPGVRVTAAPPAAEADADAADAADARRSHIVLIALGGAAALVVAALAVVGYHFLSQPAGPKPALENEVKAFLADMSKPPSPVARPAPGGATAAPSAPPTAAPATPAAAPAQPSPAPSAPSPAPPAPPPAPKTLTREAVLGSWFLASAEGAMVVFAFRDNGSCNIFAVPPDGTTASLFSAFFKFDAATGTIKLDDGQGGALGEVKMMPDGTINIRYKTTGIAVDGILNRK